MADNLVTFFLFLEPERCVQTCSGILSLVISLSYFQKLPSAPCCRTQSVFFTLRWIKGLYTHTLQREIYSLNRYLDTGRGDVNSGGFCKKHQQILICTSPKIWLLFLLITNLTYFLMYLFISLVYMFQTTQCSSSGESILSIHHLVYITLCRRLPGMLVRKDRHTGQSPTQRVIYTRWCIDTIQFSWWWALGCSKHVQKWKK